MKKHSLLFVFVCSLAATGLVACGGGGDDDDDDDDVVTVDADTTTPDIDAATTPDIDAAPAAITDQHLDETCTGQQADCGGLLVSMDYACLLFAMGDTIGICSSKCSTTADCMDGYDGPAGGQPQCVLSTGGADTYCGIVCTAPEHCPTGMSCTDLGGGSVCTADNG